MMRLYPIIKREIETKSRSLTLPIVMTIVNAVLFAVGLAGASAQILRMKNEFTLDYGAFLRIYVAVIAVQYIMLMFMVPVFTADAIAGERERGTFDLLLTTRLSAAEIVAEKLVSSYVGIAVIVISGLPAMLVPLMFGGVHIQSTIFVMLIILIEVLELMSIGMLTSSFARSSVQSIALSYAIIAALTIGPLLISGIAGMFSEKGENSLIYLTAIDPLLPVAAVLSEHIGEGTRLIGGLYKLLNGTPDPAFLGNAAFIGLMMQTAISICCIFTAIIHIMPHKSLVNVNLRELIGRGLTYRNGGRPGQSA